MTELPSDDESAHGGADWSLERPTDPPDPVEDYWAATRIEAWNVAAFWARVNRPAPPRPVLSPLLSGASGQPLPTVDDRFQRQMARRRSRHDFDDRALSRSELARVLAAAGVDAAGRRVFPRAGDFDSIHVYVLARRVDGCDWGSAWRYDHFGHTLVPVGRRDAGSSDIGGVIAADEFATMCSLTDDPAAVLVFVIEPGLTIARYGPHGDRFGLQEVGHAMQNVLLRVSEDGLIGYPMGGLVDSLIIDAIGLTNLGVRVGGGLAIGQPLESPTRHSWLRPSRFRRRR